MILFLCFILFEAWVFLNRVHGVIFTWCPGFSCVSMYGEGRRGSCLCIIHSFLSCLCSSVKKKAPVYDAKKSSAQTERPSRLLAAEVDVLASRTSGMKKKIRKTYLQNTHEHRGKTCDVKRRSCLNLPLYEEASSYRLFP